MSNLKKEKKNRMKKSAKKTKVKLAEEKLAKEKRKSAEKRRIELLSRKIIFIPADSIINEPAWLSNFNTIIM